MSVRPIRPDRRRGAYSRRVLVACVLAAGTVDPAAAQDPAFCGMSGARLQGGTSKSYKPCVLQADASWLCPWAVDLGGARPEYLECATPAGDGGWRPTSLGVGWLEDGLVGQGPLCSGTPCGSWSAWTLSADLAYYPVDSSKARIAPEPDAATLQDASAHRISCETVAGLARAGIPEHEIERILTFAVVEAKVPACLVFQGAPETLIALAKARVGQPATGPKEVPAPAPPPPARPEYGPGPRLVGLSQAGVEAVEAESGERHLLAQLTSEMMEGHLWRPASPNLLVWGTAGLAQVEIATGRVTEIARGPISGAWLAGDAVVYAAVDAVWTARAGRTSVLARKPGATVASVAADAPVVAVRVGPGEWQVAQADGAVTEITRPVPAGAEATLVLSPDGRLAVVLSAGSASGDYRDPVPVSFTLIGIPDGRVLASVVEPGEWAWVEGLTWSRADGPVYALNECTECDITDLEVPKRRLDVRSGRTVELHPDAYAAEREGSHALAEPRPATTISATGTALRVGSRVLADVSYDDPEAGRGEDTIPLFRWLSDGQHVVTLGGSCRFDEGPPMCASYVVGRDGEKVLLDGYATEMSPDLFVAARWSADLRWMLRKGWEVDQLLSLDRMALVDLPGDFRPLGWTETAQGSTTSP